MHTDLIEIDKVTFEVIQSHAEGDYIFLLHGNSSSWKTFEFLFSSELAKKYNLVAINLPGHGSSSLPDDYSLSIPSIADSIEKLIKHFSPANYFLVGHSVGGHIFSHGIDRLKSCSGLILVSAPPVSLDKLPTAFKQDPCNGAIFTDELSTSKQQDMVNALLGPAANDESKSSQLLESIERTNGRFRALLGESLAQGKLNNEYQIVQESKVPTAFIWGENDAFLQQNYCEDINFDMPLGSGNYRFQNAGHSPHLSNENEFATLVSKLISTSNN